MKSIRTISALVVILLGVMATEPVLAHHVRHRSSVHFGFFVGAPAFWYYPPPYYYYPPYYPPVVAVPSSPPVYVERGDAQPAPEQSSAYWYYCADAKAYYPYVKQCPGGWQRVVPQPPGS